MLTRRSLPGPADARSRGNRGGDFGGWRRFRHHVSRNLRHPPWDRAIAALARRQHGVVALAQFLALGMSESAVRKRVATGRLHRVHRGVFAVGHPVVTREGHWMAATLACGPEAVLSHRSAAALWDLRQT